jgi:hypothetical protein
MRILAACDLPEVEQFCGWCNKHGHDAEVGRETVTRVNGYSTFNDLGARTAMDKLWIDYCNSEIISVDMVFKHC